MILDPNSAHPDLIVSPDLSKLVQNAFLTPVPMNPGRFLLDVAVVGSEGFTTGTHCWDMNFFNKNQWIICVITQSCIGQSNTFSQVGLWYLAKDYDHYSAGTSPQPETAIHVKDIPNVIRMWLDMGHGKLL